MRHVSLIFLILFALAHSACSYATDFVVINESDAPIEVRYRIKNVPGPYALRETPATIATSQLNAHGDHQWNELPPTRYNLDQESRTITVNVMPNEALLILKMDTRDAELFLFEEITVAGANGEMRLTGQQARRAFSEVSRDLYTLTYK